MKHKLLPLLLLASILATPATAAPAVPNAPVALRTVPRAVFCASLAGSFAKYAELHGYDHLQSALLVSVGVSALVIEAKAGRAQAYVSSNALASLAHLPNRAPDGGLVPLSMLFGPALAVKPDATIVMSANELRFLPLAQRGMDVVVLARDTAELTDERVKMIATAARDLDVHVSSVWLGAAASDEGSAADGEARVLAWLAAATGGSFSDLSGRGNPCAQRL
jgi:membrane-associated protease RseP (regulator of RpoE activity)